MMKIKTSDFWFALAFAVFAYAILGFGIGHIGATGVVLVTFFSSIIARGTER